MSRRRRGVTAILCGNDDLAVGVRRAMHEAGRQVPRDVSLIGFDDVAFAAYVEPALTTLRQETAEMGRWAVATLTERVKATGGGAETNGATSAPNAAERRVVPVQLIIRASTGRAQGG